MKQIKINFSQPNDTDEFSLLFEVFDHQFAEKWFSVLQRYQERRLAILNDGVFYGEGLNDREYLLGTMQRCIDAINAYNGPHISLKPTPGIEQNFLNDLHKEFERLSVELRRKMPAQVNKALIDLNTAIHQYEVFIGKPQLPPGLEPKGFSFDVNFDTNDKDDLELEDFDLFTPDKNWGWLYLNYATVGVPVYYAYKNRETKPPVPQKKYKGDFSVHFDGDYKFTQWDQMDAYLKSTFNLDIKDKRLAIGAIPLAKYVGGPEDRDKIYAEIKKRRSIRSVELLSDRAARGVLDKMSFLNRIFGKAKGIQRPSEL